VLVSILVYPATSKITSISTEVPRGEACDAIHQAARRLPTTQRAVHRLGHNDLCRLGSITAPGCDGWRR